jgi:hypothetical protein
MEKHDMVTLPPVRHGLMVFAVKAFEWDVVR